MTTHRHPPRVVHQRDNFSCWAAALESWLSAVGDKAHERTQIQLLGGKHPQEKGTSIVGFRNLASAYGMDTKIIASQDFSADHLAGLLKSKSVILVGFEAEMYTIWWHDVVLYGVVTSPNDEPIYQVMDPAEGYTKYRRSDFFAAGPDEPVLIGWKAVGRSGRLL